MSEYDWPLSAGAPLCELSDTLYRTGRDAIFRQLSKDSTKKQFQAGLETLTQLRDELVQSLYPMHYGSLVGGHRCVNQLFTEGRARLRALQITKPAPQVPAPAPPAPPPKPRTLTDVVKDFPDMPAEDKPEGQ